MKPLPMSGILTAGMLLLSACSGGGNAASPVAPQSQMRGATQTEGAAFLKAPFTQANNVRRACNASPGPGQAACLALVRTDVAGPLVTDHGYGPPALQGAYNLPSSTAGTGQTVAVVEAYDDPNAESDLAFYRSYYSLPPCTTANGCFRKLNEDGKAKPLPAACGDCGWDVELSLDMEMVSAGCPNCNVVVMEASTSNLSDLGTAVDSAVKKVGATVVSNSYQGGGGGSKKDLKQEAKYFDHPGAIILASSGDGGYENTEGIPAAFASVVAVGGTTLSYAGKRISETVWDGSGSGCNNAVKKPSWQTGAAGTDCSGRTANDVAAVGDPNTGVAVYDTYEGGTWYVVGGTSVSSPLVGSVYALAGNASSLNAAQSLYASGASLYDITSGNNGSCSPANLCNGATGYDGPTGNGTPNGASAF